MTSRETRISEKKTDPDWDRGRSAPAPSVTKLEIGGLKIGYKERMAAPNRMKFRKNSKWPSRLEICQKNYTTGFSGRKFYTLKVRKLQLFLLKEKQRICIYISYFSSFFVSSVRSSNSHTDLLLIHHHPPPLFQITPVLNTGLSLSEPLQLYKGYNAI